MSAAVKLRFWLFALDVAYAALPMSAYYWVLRKASDAADWGEA